MNIKNSTVSCKLSPLQNKQLNLRATQLNTTVSELLRTGVSSIGFAIAIRDQWIRNLYLLAVPETESNGCRNGLAEF